MNVYVEGIHPELLLHEAERIEYEEPYSVTKLLKLAVLNLASMALEGALVTEKFIVEELSGITDNKEPRTPLMCAVGPSEAIELNRERFKHVRESQVRDVLEYFVDRGILKRACEQ